MEVRRIPNWDGTASDTELYHHGVKGQKWGVRRYQNPDGSLTAAGQKRYSKQAKKDAKEYARAKMFYGEGAGNRRKLIKATVEERSKNEYYKKEFEKYSSNQDMSKHAKAAKKERKRKDVTNSAAKTARGFKNLAMGTGASASIGAIALYAGYTYMRNNPQALNNAKKIVVSAARARKGRKIVESLF